MSQAPTPLNSEWIAAHPAPVHGEGTTKNSRGRVLAIGGSRMVPGALRLTGEAALRVGAGKLQMATPRSLALQLGLLVPEAASIALPEDAKGEIAEAGEALAAPLQGCDTLVLGPGIGDAGAAAYLLRLVFGTTLRDLTVVIDAMAIGCLNDLRNEAKPFAGRIILTPHHGEMAALAGCDEQQVTDEPQRWACEIAAHFGAVVVLKGSDTIIAEPSGAALHYGGGGIGLATGGSGDVLAGAIAGLLSRGSCPLVAAGWGVWLHGQSGRRVATTSGPIGFLAREVPAEFPRLLPQ
ncbi:hydroxyethylthiazole kinase-like uncharacterized protein yjeF [Sphingomonas sp. BE138]|uniref:NAD(P)H-hydrate dehydratase n=1 Tax=Sphingomonas sp. BE138 TaxID=2817845 RepID=UPI00285BCF70|nr:NAD(P)H-hydrate dehydratase [Sphingomonas sp. BE138]MDR6790281.1 hydroxyethylthiazole kinase-like uncharacterized protein yjeF [Sphingomonas sp. BE138]